MSACTSGSSVSFRRALHRLPEALTVELERTRAPDLAPELRAFVRLAELERTLQIGDALVEVVAPDRELRGTPEPAQGAHAQPLELLRLVGPGEIRIGGIGGLRVVMGEQGRILVAPIARALEPGTDQSVKPGAARLGNAAVDHLPCQRVLERVLRLASDRRGRPAADEVAIFEDRPRDGPAADKLQCRPAPEDAADDRRRLERRLVLARECVDASREDRLNRVRQLLHDRAGLDDSRQQLFEEERIPLRPLDQSRPRLARELAGDELVEHLGGLTRREGVQPDKRGVAAAAAPRTTAVEQFRTGGADHKQWAAHLMADPVEQVEQRILRPVQVLHEQDGRRCRRQLAQELDPGLLEAVAHCKRVRVAGEIEAESQPEDLPVAESPAHLLLRLVLEDSQVLSKNLPERPIREVAVGQTPAGAPNRL